MCAGYNHTFLVVQDSSQTLGAAQAQAVQLAGGGQGYIVLADGAGVDDNLRICHSVSRVRTGKLEPALLQALRFLAGDAVATAHPVPHFQKHACNAAHAGTGHANKMNAHRVVPVQKPFA